MRLGRASYFWDMGYGKALGRMGTYGLDGFALFLWIVQ